MERKVKETVCNQIKKFFPDFETELTNLILSIFKKDKSKFKENIEDFLLALINHSNSKN